MRERGVQTSGAMRVDNRTGPEVHSSGDPGGFREGLSVYGGRSVWPGHTWMEGDLRAGGGDNPSPGPLSGGGQRASGPGHADGGALGTAGGAAGDQGPGFDRPVEPGGYAWWYVDALSKDRRYGLTVIAFVGSVFSPYYAWARRRDPLDHCAVNVALYGPHGTLWAMTERKRGAVRWAATLSGSDGRGRFGAATDSCSISTNARRRSRAGSGGGSESARKRSIRAASCSRKPAGTGGGRSCPAQTSRSTWRRRRFGWRGRGYFDQNAGAEPLELGFRRWTWSRSGTGGETTVLYDAERRRGPPLSLALRFDAQGGFETRPPPPVATLPRTRWGLHRATRADDGLASALRSFEDTPFYARGLVAHTLFGERVESVHESLSLDRFANPAVRLMLPFRMPRR